jgi:hypothetical protein
MLDIRIKNTSLDLGKVSITFELTSPIFNSVGSFSYPFTLPATAKNKTLLNFPARINNGIENIDYESEIYLEGLLWKRGKLVISESNSETIKCYFTVGEGYFYNQIKDLKLKDLDLGGERAKADYTDDFFNPDKIFNKVYTLSSEMAVTDWEVTTTDKRIKNKDRLRPTVIITDAISGFSDPNFWGKYNLLEPDKSIQSAIDKIRKNIEKQKEKEKTKRGRR